MGWMRGAVLVVLLAGCQQLFHIDQVPAGGDAGVIDGTGSGGRDGSGSGTCQTDTKMLAFAGVTGMVADDFSGDTRADLAIASADGLVHVLVSTGRDFQPSAAQVLEAGTLTAASGDVTGDNKPDLLVASSGGNKVYVLSDTGSGLMLSSSFDTGTGPSGIALGDYNGDGAVDAVVPNATSGNLTIARGNGSGTFSASTINVTLGAPTGIARIDLDGNTLMDFVVSESTLMEVTRVIGQPSGFSTATTGQPDFSHGVAVGDFNGDMHSDIALSGIGDVVVAFGPALTNHMTPTITAPSGPILAADIDHDGHPDLLVGTAGGVVLVRGIGNGDFVGAVDFLRGMRTTALASGDFDGNGALDVAIAADDGSVTVVYGCP
jgi:hypothetical protein